MGRTSDPFYIVLIFFVLVEFLGVILVNAMASIPDDPLGWFRNTTGDISDLYYVDITPAGWAFSIWAIIYTWQGIWIVYALINICRTNKFGKVYVHPPMISATFLAVYAINLVLNIAWLFTWDRQYIPASTAVLALLTLSLYVCLWLNHRAVKRDIDQLYDHHKVDLWLNTIFVQNGLTIYATWCTIASLLNFAMALTYFAGVDQITSCIISLSILTGVLVLYFILDNFVWEWYLRSTFMAYPVVIWATTAALLNNWDAESVVSIFTAVIVGLACAAFVMKNLLLIVRSCCRKSENYAKKGDEKMAMNDVA